MTNATALLDLPRVDPAADSPHPLPAGCDPLSLRHLAQDVARAAGELAERSRADVEVAATKSSPTDVVTQADRACEDLIRRRLRAQRPDDAILGEERGLEPGTSGLTWVVDPIDGTVNYLYGIWAYAVSIAVVVGDPLSPGGWAGLAGCIVSPATGHVWAAAAGSGATLNDKPLLLGPPPGMDQALVATGFGYVAQRRRVQARVLADLLPRVRDIRRIGSAAIDLGLVAAGRVDAFYERGLNPWDMAAGALIVQEAGGRVVGIDGNAPGEHLVVAGADPLCSRLAGALSELGAGQG